MAQAQYDFDYASITTESSPSTCGSDALANNDSTMCGLFNNTLSARTYQGVYGEVSGILPLTKYSFTSVSSGFNPEGYLLYTLADGVIVGFNPNAKNCSLETGQELNSDLLSGSLSNCIGFIDVNGSALPNKEVTCKDESETSLSPNTICTTGGAMGDIFPIVFHDGSVEPASNAARAILTSGGSGSGSNVSGSNSTQSEPEPVVPAEPKKITYEGNEYEYKDNLGIYLRESGNGYTDIYGHYYSKNSDGNYVIDGIVYDENFNPIKKGTYDYLNGHFVKKDEYGNYKEAGGYTYTKQTDEIFTRSNGPYTYKYDKDLNQLGMTYNDQWYEYTGNPGNAGYVQKDGDNYVDPWNGVYTKQANGTYTDTWNYVYDKNMKLLGQNKDGYFYQYKDRYGYKGSGSGFFYREDEFGNIITEYGTYTKQTGGLYENDGRLYDKDLIEVMDPTMEFEG